MKKFTKKTVVLVALLLCFAFFVSACSASSEARCVMSGGHFYDNDYEDDICNSCGYVRVPLIDPMSTREDLSVNKGYLEENFSLTQSDVEDAKTLLQEFEESVDSFWGKLAYMRKYVEFADARNYIQYQMTLAEIIYYMDVTDSSSSQRYMDVFNTYQEISNLELQALKRIYKTASKSVKDTLFYGLSSADLALIEGDTDKYFELTTKNEEITMEYYQLDPVDPENADRVASLYVEFLMNQQEISEIVGYQNYYDFASDIVFGRDYGVEEIEAFRGYTIQYLLPKMDSVRAKYSLSTQELRDRARSFSVNDFDKMDEPYVINYLNSLKNEMGNCMRDALKYENTAFAETENTTVTAFCTNIPYVDYPFCFFGMDQDSFTLVHEIGHYYATFNVDLDCMDLLETHSQSNEGFFLNYLRGQLPKAEFEVLESNQLYQAYSTILTGVFMDEFARRVYALEDGVEGYTAKDFDNIVTDIKGDYLNKSLQGNVIVESMYDYWKRTVFDYGVYMISYATSWMPSLYLYKDVQTNYADAMEKYRIIVEDVTAEDGFVGALEKAKIPSPFEEGMWTYLFS